MSIWILSTLSSCPLSINKITNEFDKRNFTDYKIIMQENIIFKITQDGLDTFIDNIKVTEYPNVLWFRVNAIHCDFQITLLRHFESLGIRIVNSIDAILKATNKVWHFIELAKHNIPIPATFSYCDSEIKLYDDPENTLQYPIIAKAVRGSLGNKVFTIPNKIIHKELLGVLDHTVPYLYQEYIQESHGRDLRIVVVDKKSLITILRKSTDGSVRANISQGGTSETVTGVYPEAEKLACRIAEILDIDICGVDLLFKGDNEFVCCEVNNRPDFKRDVYTGVVETPICDFLLKICNEKNESV